MGESEAVQKLKTTWGAGDFGVVAPRVISASLKVVEAAGIADGETVLDVACGTGNSAIPAAKLGAKVTALDIVPALLEQGEAAAAREGLEIEWVEGDAGALQFEDGSYDVVISVFGCMFAPDQQAAANEIARTLKPGGRMAIGAWTPDSVIATSFARVAGYMPPPPEGFQPPVMWGNAEHVTELFAGSGIEPSFETHAVDFQFDSAAESVDHLSEFFGPMVMMRTAMEAEGKWPEVREKLIAGAEEDNTSTEGDLRYAATYLVSTGTKA